MASSSQSFRMEHLNHLVSQAITTKQTISVRLDKAKKVFIAADDANIVATTKVLDFKASKPDGNGEEGLSKGAAAYFRHAKRAQKATQEKCERAIEVLEGLQCDYADALIAVREARRELREAAEELG